MAEFLTWNAYRGVSATLGSFIAFAVNLLLSLLILFMFALIMLLVEEVYLNKKIISTDADWLDWDIYREAHMPVGYECYYSLYRLSCPGTGECAKTGGCKHCGMRVSNVIKHLEKI